MGGSAFMSRAIQNLKYIYFISYEALAKIAERCDSEVGGRKWD